jgi:hypothetical protein
VSALGMAMVLSTVYNSQGQDSPKEVSQLGRLFALADVIQHSIPPGPTWVYGQAAISARTRQCPTC